MATTKKRPSKRPKSGRRSVVGVAAVGSSGSWSIDVDETIRGPHKWFLHIDGPVNYLYFEIPSPRIVDRAVQFLEGRSASRIRNGNGAMEIGRFGKEPVHLVRDDEGERYFLRIGSGEEPAMFLTLVDKDLEMFRDSLRQARDDLADSGLLE